MKPQPSQNTAHIPGGSYTSNIDLISEKAEKAIPIDVRNSEKIVGNMSLKEKIGQKIILDFRYWQEDNLNDSKKNMVQLSDTIKNLLKDHDISGVILFPSNLHNIVQIRKLTTDLRTINSHSGMGLFIATENEGDDIFSLPRKEFHSFASNMALGAVHEGDKRNSEPSPISIETFLQGLLTARDLKSMGINTQLAPVMDVNTNPFNPVINVRSFGDDPNKVGLLAKEMIRGISKVNIVSVGKHFPGQGSIACDSRQILSLADHNRRVAETTDLAPYRITIDAGQAPDMIMTAHIQYPALDDSTIKDKTGEDIIVPATLSRKIQTGLLRNELNYKGVIITDALDMQSISNHFNIDDLMEYIFNAGVDIALMPVKIGRPGDIPKLTTLIENIVAKVNSGKISEHAIAESVMRIVSLKLMRNILPNSDIDIRIIKDHARTTEERIAKAAITLLKNTSSLIPVADKNESFYILMPKNKHNQIIKKTLENKDYYSTCDRDVDQTPWDVKQRMIQRCSILIIGSLFPVDNKDGTLLDNKVSSNKELVIREAMTYAKQLKKKVIHITLGAPYDVVKYDDLADTILAAYSSHRHDDDKKNGISLQMATEAIIGGISPKGKLPVNIYDMDSHGNRGELKYPRGYGITSEK